MLYSKEVKHKGLVMSRRTMSEVLDKHSRDDGGQPAPKQEPSRVDPPGGTVVKVK